MMKTVYVCSPLGGNVAQNIEKAKQYGRYVLSRGMAPVIPHFYATILNDNNQAERELGMQAGKSLLFKVDALWIFGNKVTRGMEEEIRFAKKLNLELKHISDEVLEEFGGRENEQIKE